jgi:hypothetical protein
MPNVVVFRSHAMTENQAQNLWEICSSTRLMNFEILGTSRIVVAVSVANHDSERPEVIRILRDQNTMGPPGACNGGMVMWISRRTWYPVN